MGKKDKQKEYKHFWIIVAISIVLIVGLWYWNYNYLISLKPDDRGTFGDMFGAVNAIFSGLAFAGIIISLYLQRIDLKNQREQLKLNHEEIQTTNREFNIQNETLQIQKFENTFFNMLSIHHQIVDSMDFNMFTIRIPLDNYVGTKLDNNDFRIAVFNDKNIKSRDVFKNTLLLLYYIINDDLNNKHLYYNFGVSDFILENPNVKTRFKLIYQFIYSKLDTSFGHYFRNLYRMIKIIDEKTFVKDDLVKDFNTKYSYTSIIRAQLSDSEVQWMFFNCISDMGYKKFKPLVEKYTLLKIINLENKVYKYYAQLYEATAFKKPKSSELSNHITSFKINKF